ncbi:histone-lysine N-methyltransferase PRDM9 [Caerostris darwini]|uniref:Histone-lysine N-methyltransferase PRDM9 n=1 Tax=Caerostris darwini TaxID=1538125 RepID=A0AAV4VT28_9ARAC|nr:histone-lysine N-methyltransferase PRDM9 [Caerostris darwini]
MHNSNVCSFRSFSGITPKMPEFLMTKFKRPQTKRLKTNANSMQPKGASNDLIACLKQKNTSPKNEHMIEPLISLRNASPKEFAQALLGSAQNILKLLEEKMQKSSPYPIKDLLLRQSNFLPGESQKGRYPKRNIQPKCYKEEDVPDQDQYLHCDVCNEEYDGVCPVHSPMLLVCDTKVRKDDPQKARKSLPLKARSHQGERREDSRGKRQNFFDPFTAKRQKSSEKPLRVESSKLQTGLSIFSASCRLGRASKASIGTRGVDGDAPGGGGGGCSAPTWARWSRRVEQE